MGNSHYPNGCADCYHYAQSHFHTYSSHWNCDYTHTSSNSSTPQPTSTFEPLHGQPIGGYIFSPARPIPNLEGKSFDFFEWVDNDRLLVVENLNRPTSSLAVLNINSGELQPYDKKNPQGYIDDVIWLSGRQGVAYLTTEYEPAPPKVHLWIDDGLQPLVPIYTSTHRTQLVQTPDGNGIIFYDAEDRFQQIGGASVQLPTSITDYMPSNLTTPWFAKAHSCQDKTKAVYFNEEWLMVADFVTGEVKSFVPRTLIKNSFPEIYHEDMPKIYNVRAVTWSPHGDKLAIKTGILGGGAWNRLFILDLVSGQLDYVPNIDSYILGEAWAPDNEHLMILRQVNDLDGITIGALYLINILDKSMELVAALPNNAWVDSNMFAWSPDGKYIVVAAADLAGIINTYTVEVETVK